MFDFIGKRLIGNPELSEATRARIAAVQKQIDDSGIRHLHFSWNYEKMIETLPDLDAVANSLCSTLEAYFRGEYTEAEPDWEDDIDPPEEALEIMRNTKF